MDESANIGFAEKFLQETLETSLRILKEKNIAVLYSKEISDLAYKILSDARTNQEEK